MFDISKLRYKVTIQKPSGQKYYISNIITSLVWSEPKGQLASRVQASFTNIKFEGTWLAGLFDVRDRLFLYANTGNGDEEVFRGVIWDFDYKSSLQKEITVAAYDNLIYFQESDDSLYYSAGKATSSIFGDICNRWGVKYRYSFLSITHPKLPLRGKLADIFQTDLLDEVKAQKGKMYVMHSEKDIICVDYYGYNDKIFEMHAKKNVMGTNTSKTMGGMVTKVIITGKKDDNDREPIESTRSRNTDKYGTLQKIINRTEGTELSEAESEAEEILNENAEPKMTMSINDLVDIPYVKKGHTVKVAAGNLLGNFYVSGITHDCVAKTASVDLEEMR
jgi:hypothetical protein